MKSFVKIVLVGILGYFLQFFLPWWYIIIAAFLVNALMYSKGWHSFMSGFWGIFLLWAMGAFYIDIKSSSILSEKISEIFQLPNPLVLILATALIGGICGGFSGLTGSLLRNVFQKERGHYYH